MRFEIFFAAAELSLLSFVFAKVPSLKEVNFGKVKLWAVEHFWTDFDLTKRRDNKMDTYKTLQHETDNKISGKKRTNILEKLAIGSSNLTKYNSFKYSG